MSNPERYVAICDDCGRRKMGGRSLGGFLCHGCRCADTKLRKRYGDPGFLAEKKYKQALQEIFLGVDRASLLSEETRRRLYAKR